MSKRQVLLVVMLIGSMLLLQGCLAAAVGVGAAGTIAYARGDLEAIESQSIDEVYEATLIALKELELLPTSKSKDALVAEIITYDAQDKKVTINLKSMGDGSTKISIRIGVFGSESKSRLIYQKIRDNLNKQPAHTRVP